MPGFAVFFEAHLFGFTVRVEAEHGLRRADFYRDYVPDIERDYVGGYEVDVALGVDGAAVAADGVGGAGFVGSGAEALGAFDLDAEEFDPWSRAVVADEVVALAVSEGLGDGEAALVGAVEEKRFRNALPCVLGCGGCCCGAGWVYDGAYETSYGDPCGDRKSELLRDEKGELGAPLKWRDFWEYP